MDGSYHFKSFGAFPLGKTWKNIYLFQGEEKKKSQSKLSHINERAQERGGTDCHRNYSDVSGFMTCYLMFTTDCWIEAIMVIT